MENNQRLNAFLGWLDNFETQEIGKEDEIRFWQGLFNLCIEDRVKAVERLKGVASDFHYDHSLEISKMCTVEGVNLAPTIPEVEVYADHFDRNVIRSLVHSGELFSYGWKKMGVSDSSVLVMDGNKPSYLEFGRFSEQGTRIKAIYLDKSGDRQSLFFDFFNGELVGQNFNWENEKPSFIESFGFLSDRSAVFARYDSGKKILFEHGLGMTPEVVLTNFQPSMDYGNREFFVHQRALGLVGVVDPQRDYVLIASRKGTQRRSALDLDMDNPDSYLFLAKFGDEYNKGVQFDWKNVYDYVLANKRGITPRKRSKIKGEKLSMYGIFSGYSSHSRNRSSYLSLSQDDVGVISEFTGINPASKIFDAGFQEKRLVRTPINHEARVVAPRD